MSTTTQATSTDAGATIANRMLWGGILAAVVGILIWAVANVDRSDGAVTVMAFGATVIQLGVVIAVLGLHALAVRAPRS